MSVYQLSQPQNRPIPVPPDAASIAYLINTNIKPGAGVSLAFNEGILNIYRDRLGDWTISVAVYTKSNLYVTIQDSLEELGYFKATEVEGKLYLLWTTALHSIVEKRRQTEQTLLETLKLLEKGPPKQYIS